MKHSFYAAGLFTLAASALSYGQTAVAIGTIPFDFHVGGVVLPAGEYIVSRTSDLILVRGVAGKPTVMTLSLPDTRRAVSSHPSLVFEHYGEDYFLAKIWTADSEEGRAFPRSKQERELARRSTFKGSEQVALQTAPHSSGDGR